MVTRCSVVLMTQSGSVNFFFFLIELNWIDSLHSSPSSPNPVAARLAAAFASCLLHTGGRLAHCTLDVPPVHPGLHWLDWRLVGGVGKGWLGSLTADSSYTHTYTDTRRDRQASPLYRFHSLTLLRSRGDARLGSRWGWRPVGAVRRW